MFNELSFLMAGFLLGIEHALDADHLAAISTVVSETKNAARSLLTGIYWGIGHTFTLLLVGLAILFFHIQLPVIFASIAETLVGFMLIFLGVLAIRKFIQEKIHAHKHPHESCEHVHLHQHIADKQHEHRHAGKSLLVGMLHGLAGSAALMLLIVASTNVAWLSLFYILIFGLGSILGMSLVALAISLPALRLGNITSPVRLVSGIFSILIGVLLIHTVGLL